MNKIQEAKDRLSRIKSEVDELHPLLAQLFPNLPNITKVENTHGPNEKGADFVLHKLDVTLGQTVYIGVVAKKDKVAVDISDVERQIDECSMPRYVSGGTKEVYLNEIWVITPKTISQNAKDKIYHKFSSSNVQFLDRDVLAKWVIDYAPYYFDDIPPDVGGYLAAVKSEMTALDMRSSLLLKKDINYYLKPNVQRYSSESYSEKGKKPEEIDLLNEIQRSSVVLIEGEMGYGKSKLLRRLASECADYTFYADKQILPIYLSYRELQDAYSLSIDDVLASKLNAIKAQVDATCLLLIDGLDEVPEADDDGFADFIQLVDEISSKENVRAIVATRPIKKIDEEAVLESRIVRCVLKPLALAEIKLFVENVCGELNLSKRLLNDLKKSHLFKQLPQSPIAVILLSNLLLENQTDLPSNITELYSKSLELMLGRWDIEKGMTSQKEYEVSQKLCGLLADYMWTNSLDMIAASEAKQIFDQYLSQRNLRLNHDDLFEKITGRTGVVAYNEKNSAICFRHRSFMEYFYAKYHNDVGQLEIDARVFNPYWTNVYFFYLGLKKDCPDLLTDILSFPVSSEGERWVKVINVGNYLLAAFSSPYKIVENNLASLFIEAARLLIDIYNNKTETKLNMFPKLHVLWLVQYILRENYAFEFFAPAIEDAYIEVEDSLEEDDVKAYAIFLLACVGMELDEFGPATCLVKDKKINNLPLPVVMGLEAELELKKNNKVGDQSATKEAAGLFKCFDKHIKRTLKRNPSLRLEVRNVTKRAIIDGGDE